MNINDSKIYLCKADHSLLGTITGIKIETCSLIKNATDLWELTFEINKYIENNGQLVQSDYYDSIDEMMRLYFDSNDIQAFFMIDSEPVITGDSYQEIKKVTAHSIECELCYMILQNLKVNCGTPDSQEYLVTDENNNPSNIYKGLPIEYVSLVNYNNPQLSLLHLVLQNTGWSVKKNIPDEICKLMGSFETSENVYSFLMKTVASTFSIIFDFDRKNKQISFVKASEYGKDTGIFISMRNLLNNFEVTSSSTDVIMTKIIPTGANNLGIEQVNFGKDYILNLDYFMNTLNEYGDHKFVSKDLYDKYNLWKNYRDTEKVMYENNEYTRRELYSQLTKLYNQSMVTISELKNRVPNDGCMIDYTKFSLEELKQSLTAYKNALNALLACYKNEIIEKYNLPKDTMITINNDFTLTFNPELEVSISPTLLPQSVYWYDYYAYKEKIIPQIIETLKMYCETDENGNLVTDENGNYIELEHGNPKYYTDANIVQNIESYLYEWSLYGLDELETKRKAWSEAANLLFKKCFISSGTIENPIYRVPDDNGWNSLKEDEKLEFTTKTAFFNQLNQYLDYMSLDDKRENSLINTKGKGIIRQCTDIIEARKQEIDKEAERQNNYNNLRASIANSVTLENFVVNNNLIFSEKDLCVVQSMIRTKHYSNDCILTTNLDDPVSVVDRQEELYQSALEELYKISQPQYSFKTELDNLYVLDEFKEYRETLDIGNFIRVGLEIQEELHDNDFIKLRLISITYNPLEINTQLSIEFSTITKSLNGIDDLDFLLNNMTSSSGSSSSSSASSSNSTFGNNDANVQISNNMLNALLNTEMFGTAVSDVILDSIQANKGNFNTLLSHSGIFGSLEKGTTTINGDCINTGSIKSNNYPYTKNYETGENELTGSMLDLSNGTFSFAGEKLIWDGRSLSIRGTLDGCDGNFKGSLNVNEKFIVDKNGNLNINDRFTVDNNGNVIANGKLTATNAEITGVINATKSNIIESAFIDGDITANTICAKKFLLKSENWTPPQYSNKLDIFSMSNAIINSSQKMRVYINNMPTDGDKTIRFSIKAIVHSQSEFASDTRQEIFDIYHNIIKVSNNSKVGTFDINLILLNYSSCRCSSHLLWNETHEGETMISAQILSIDTSDASTDSSGDYPPTYSGSISKIEFIHCDDFDNQKEHIISYCFGNILKLGKGIIIDSDTPNIKFNSIDINNNSIIGFSDFNFNIRELNKKTNEVTINSNELMHKGVYSQTITASSNLYIDNDGNFKRTSSSSRRYKTNISQNLPNNISPHKIYDLNIYTYRYKNSYISSTDQRYQTDILGFIAEDIYEKFPIACNLDKNGNPEMWNINILFPALTKLVQEQHTEIETIKKQLQELKENITNGTD